MDAKISDDFWSDPRMEEMEAGELLAALWLMTNSRRSLCGVVEVSRRRFEFETRTPYEALGKLCEVHAKGFVKVGEKIWLRNFIRRQYGSGNALVRNNFCKPLLAEIRAYEGLPLQGEILSEYPELREKLEGLDPQDLNKGLPSPREEKSREEQRERDVPSMAGRSALLGGLFGGGDDFSGESNSGMESGEFEKKGAAASDAVLMRLRAIFRMRPGTPLDAGQATAWKKNRAAAEAMSEEELEVLEWYYGQPVADRAQDYRRRDLATLLNNLSGEVIRAQTAAVSAGRTPKKEGRPEDVPEGWRDLLSEQDPERPIPEHWGELPESVRKWVWELWRKKQNGGDELPGPSGH